MYDGLDAVGVDQQVWTVSEISYYLHNILLY